MASYNLFDDDIVAYRNALSRIHLHEEANPMLHGEVVSDPDTYNKVQQLLDCDQMEHSHKFLLDIDFDSLTDEIAQKVDDLYQLAVSQGFIQSDVEEADAAEDVSDEPATDGGYENATPPDQEEIAVKDAIPNHDVEVPVHAFTCLYSAMKNGEIKTGECYSNAATIEKAKQDATAKLMRLGFTAVDIIAIEENDLDARATSLVGDKPFDANGTTFAPPVVTAPVPTTDGPDKEAEMVSNLEDPEADVEEPTPEEDSEDVEEYDDEPEAEEDLDDDSSDDGEIEEIEDDSDDSEESDDEDEEVEESLNDVLNATGTKVSEADEEKENDEKEEPEEEPDEPADDEELSRQEKLDYFKLYLAKYKELLIKMKTSSYQDFDLAGRADFYSRLAKIWGDKPNPTKFMTDANVKQIENMRVKKA